MAVFAATDYAITINSVDLSDHLVQAELPITAEELDDTAMGDTYRSRIGGLKDWSLTLQFHQDFAASEVYATIYPLIGTVTAITIKPTSGAKAATNPSFEGNVLVNDFKPISATVGDLATVSVTWPGSGALTADTTP